MPCGQCSHGNGVPPSVMLASANDPHQDHPSGPKGGGVMVQSHRHFFWYLIALGLGFWVGRGRD